jgi:hypothetical protein
MRAMIPIAGLRISRSFSLVCIVALVASSIRGGLNQFLVAAAVADVNRNFAAAIA